MAVNVQKEPWPGSPKQMASSTAQHSVIRGLLITDARVATPDGISEPGWLATKQTAIEALGAGKPDRALYSGHDVIDAKGRILLPGFIDVHVHGAAGHEVMDAEVEALEAMARFYASHGVTSFLPTTLTAGTDQTLAALGAIADAMSRSQAGARILGAHLEGPYLNAVRCGAQDPAAIRPANLGEARLFFDTGVVRLITLAPEVEGNLVLIDECVRRGINVSIGHSDATYEQIKAAVSRGATHLTHAFNAMRPLHHREPGGAGAALMIRELMAELIADNVHVHPAVMRLLVQARGSAGVVLVSDAIRATGLTTGESSIGGWTIRVAEGAARLADGTLAGSVLTMDRGLRNLLQATGLPLAELWPTTSRNGALAAKVSRRKGELSAGLDADLVLVDDEINVQLTVVEGRVVFQAE
jgi:N-acetylglucosamine-6-phosphate deacetylase